MTCSRVRNRRDFCTLVSTGIEKLVVIVERNLPKPLGNRGGELRNRLRINPASRRAVWHSTCKARTAQVLTIITKRCSLLVVEDDLAVREAITRALEAEDYQVSSAASCRDAMQQFNQQPIDVVLLDLNLGKEEGWKFFHALKEQRPELPIIVTSAKAYELEHSSATRASGVLEKPFDVPVLLALLKKAGQPTNSHAEVKPAPNCAITSIESGRFPDSALPDLPRPEQPQSAHSAQIVENQQPAHSGSDGIPSAK